MRRIIIPLLFTIACGAGQISGSFDFAFDQSVVCNPTVSRMSFVNKTGQELVIESAVISAGTDPNGNFSLEGIVVDSQEIKSVGGAISKVLIPEEGEYEFRIGYTPRTSGDHEAMIDIAYSQPTIGVQQVHLSGKAEGDANCLSFNEGGAVLLDGPMKLEVTEIVAATSKIGAAISSDQGTEPFISPLLEIKFDLSGQTATLEPITEEIHFFLPPPRPEVPILGQELTGGSLITSAGAVTGSYQPTNGSLTLPDLLITLDSDFNATFTVTLTTEPVSLATLPVPINGDAIKEFGDSHYDFVKKDQIFGGRIDPETNEIALVGTSQILSFSLDPGASSLFSELGGTTLAILIKGKLVTQ